ncbi:TIGR03083 family protein [Streptomyces sp. 2224.1]|uniref:maleylpyruvate isomerase family mycothiol-dependent enzyme n=1 Tax=Streptomyces sp. 2224.1 TaxID=1881020 RepID=UPI00089522EF|nr:maleylpyruvate isomerase family mycothiol-dependent enzyme [Streptomyces sp. 2224.1]SEE21672.1 TIGR03083 family protein [Streptomyces sp. 2224.1]
MNTSAPSGRETVTPAAHRAAVAAETARFVAALDGAQLSLPVPGCPGWTLLDLVRHTGSVQRWFSLLLRQRIQEPPRSRDVELELPADDTGWADWLTAGAALAAEAFAETDPDAPMWAWGADHHARFWVRRMLFETLVHRTDAERAVGARTVIDPVLAADGVDEFLVNLPFATSFAPRVAHLRGNGETLRFRCTDTTGDWLVRLRPDGFEVAPQSGDAAAGPTDAVVQGAAADLLLLVYGRQARGTASVEQTGDAELLARWFTHSAF